MVAHPTITKDVATGEMCWSIKERGLANDYARELGTVKINTDEGAVPVEADAYITDGVNSSSFEEDDDDIPAGTFQLVVINLNYVWDVATSKWVRMTQP